MQRIEFTDAMVLTLKGAPLSCLIVLALAGQPLSAQYLERKTGYSDKIVNKALLTLQDLGMITRNDRYAWRIAIDVRQLPLAALEEDEVSEEELPIGTEQEMPEDGSLASPEGSRRNSESEKFRVLTSSRSLTKSRLINQPLLLDADDPEFLRVSDNLAACDRFGIREPKRSTISRLKHTTARLICFHCSKAPNFGMAIYRIENDWKVSEDWIDPIDCEVLASKENVCAQTLPDSDLQIWNQVIESVKPDFRLVDYETWIKTAVLVSIEPDVWTIRMANQFAAEWIRKNALERLQSAAGVVIKVEG